MSILRALYERNERRSRAPVLARLKGDRADYRRVLDISSGGLRFRGDRRLRTGQQICVSVQFPDLNESVEIHGKVAWRRRDGTFGMDFRHIDDEDAGLLGVMIAHQEVMARTAYCCG